MKNDNGDLKDILRIARANGSTKEMHGAVYARCIGVSLGAITSLVRVGVLNNFTVLDGEDTLYQGKYVDGDFDLLFSYIGDAGYVKCYGMWVKCYNKTN